MRINYVIGTWSGKRINAYSGLEYYGTVLKNHIQKLGLIKNSLNQITIMKPFNPVKNTYYEIELNDKIKVIDCPNEYQSYGQWLKAVELFVDDFDYFIFIEDDYVPATDDFDLKLIEMYEEGTYLCSMAEPYAGFPHHAAISNGIISKKTIENLIHSVDFKKWFTENHQYNTNIVSGGINYQIVFSYYLINNGISIVDYRKKYAVDFLRSGKIIDFSFPDAKNNEKIFTPIQTIHPMGL